MDFKELIKKRYSVRAYRSDPVEDEKLEQVLGLHLIMSFVSALSTGQNW